MNVRELAYGIGDIVASHNILSYLRPGEDSARLITGATLAALGYAFGPELSEKLSTVGDGRAAEISREHVTYAAAGALGGAVIGYLLGTDYGESQLTLAKNSTTNVRAPSAESQRTQEASAHRADALTQGDSIRDITQRIEEETTVTDPKKPGGLIIIGSAVWLGYSALLAEQTDDFRERQVWGLGTGAAGYLAGPDLFESVKDMVLPNTSANTALEAYSRGSALFGGVVGAGGMLLLRNRLQRDKTQYIEHRG